jgi:hypothetical protein
MSPFGNIVGVCGEGPQQFVIDFNQPYYDEIKKSQVIRSTRTHADLLTRVLNTHFTQQCEYENMIEKPMWPKLLHRHSYMYLVRWCRVANKRYLPPTSGQPRTHFIASKKSELFESKNVTSLLSTTLTLNLT